MWRAMPRLGPRRPLGALARAAAALRLLLVVALLGGPVGLQAGTMHCQPIQAAVETACHEPPPPCHGAQSAAAPDAEVPAGEWVPGDCCGAACSPLAVVHADHGPPAAAHGSPVARHAAFRAPLSPIADKPPPRIDA